MNIHLYIYLNHRFKLLKSLQAVVAVMQTAAKGWAKRRFHIYVFAGTKRTFNIL